MAVIDITPAAPTRDPLPAWARAAGEQDEDEDQDNE
jgi:hypothetical protein